MTLGLFWLFKSSNMKNMESIAKLGRDYSLLIYLLHPFVLSVLKFVAMALSWSADALLLVQLTAGVLISVALPIALGRYAPRISMVFMGDWSFSGPKRSSST